jgi:TonB family protein
MKRYCFLIFFLLCFQFVTKAQAIEDLLKEQLYQKADYYFEQNDLFKADSLYTGLLKNYPDRNAYYKLGLIKYRMNNICESCKYFEMSFDFLYEKLCKKLDSVMYEKQSDTLVKYYGLQWVTACSGRKVRYYKCNMLTRKAVGYEIISKNSVEGNLPLRKDSFPDFAAMKPDSYQVFDEFNLDSIIEYPLYSGGDKARLNFLRENMKYPEGTNSSGTVYITFKISKGGQVNSIGILQGVDYFLDEEARRVVGLMPKWIPGKIRGEISEIQFNIPLKFTLISLQ